MIHAAGKYTQVSSLATKPGLAAPAACPEVSTGQAAFHIFTRRAKGMTPGAFRDWWWRELKDGGELNTYLRREKAQTAARYRAVARANHGKKPNYKSELHRRADIPLRDYFRWLAVDPDFWKDDKNLKSLKRDNPDVCVYD
ncbi:MAG: hypothetical protein IPK15_24230 [Verrucomicrobia bacterium]|nr:hypothetical protein [Verrucomicrobiota bacterium]